MFAWIGSAWLLPLALAAVYLVLTVRTTRHLARRGRRPLAWFFITLLAAPVAWAVLWRDYIADRHRACRQDAPRGGPPKGRCESAPPRRCRHCGAPLLEDPTAPDRGRRTCGECGMPVKEEHLA